MLSSEVRQTAYWSMLEECGQQPGESYFSPLLGASEVTLLHPVLSPPVEEGCGEAGKDPGEQQGSWGLEYVP